jgi:hypothetical protein
MKIVVPERVVEAARKAGHAAQQEALRACREPFCELDHDKEFTLAALPAALQEWIASGEAQKTVGYVTSNGRWAVYALEDVDMDPGEFSAIIIKMEPDND